MTLFRRQNLMPAMAGAALVCAYGAVRGGQWFLRNRSRGWAYAASLLLGGLLLVRPFTDVYQQAVPTTWKVATQTLQLRLPPLGKRHVAYEPASVTMRVSYGGERAALTAVPSLAALSPAMLDFTDAEVFPLSRTRGSKAAFYQDRLRRLSREGLLEIGARPFLSRGEPVVLLLHPWTPAGDPIPLSLERSAGSPRLLTARLPSQLSPADVLSLELVRPARETGSGGVWLRPAGRNVPFYYAGSRLRQTRVLTPRFRYAAGMDEVQVRASALANPKRFRLRLWRWNPPSSLTSLQEPGRVEP
jgi:hypothetical protein